MFYHKLKCLLFLKLVASRVYCVENCSNLSPESLLIGHYCLSTCDHVCAQRVSFPGTINCEGGRGRLICMSTNLTPHGYPLCEVLNLEYCKSNTCACWYPF
ncbi:hypothetical protein MACJ_003497 [Theileria orientalis]|uniref:Secreted protein n=1 Tax=Theileria orientalis TaxID=68886 RepID=A0A976SKE9_THEOR|nr:hypothetical protein MACJ_003497 [Theileria orientalis]